MKKQTLQNGFEEKFVTFIDLLGFKEAILKITNQKELNEVKKKVISIQNNLAKKGDYQIKTHSFSDCIVRERSHFRGALFSEILSIGFGLGFILKDGHLVRGALTNGFHYSSKKILISPAFLRAYNLESREAIYPRVIIDPKMLAQYETRKDWGGDAHSHEEDKKYVYGLLRKDFDGYYFIDYLKVAYRNSDEYGPEVLQDLLGIQKKLILQGLQNEDTKIREKYKWLGRYQNETIKDYPDEWKTKFSLGWKIRLSIDERIL